MSVQVNLNLKARDFRFELSDSCNCCWSPKPTGETLVYVTPSGGLEKYSFKKATDADFAHMFSSHHLICTIKDLVDEEDKERMIDNVMLLTGFNLESTPDSPFTLQKMEMINTAIEKIGWITQDDKN